MNQPSRPFLTIAVAVLSLGMTGSVLAGDVARGQEKSLSCQACHGADGNSPIPMFPVIAGQHQDYLLHSMLSYKSGERTNPIMKAIVDPLSEQDMEDLAAYYAAQKGLYAIDAGLGTEVP